ncbi:hypothetical protein LCGC14_3008110, partial [marine sediment metagenome]
MSNEKKNSWEFKHLEITKKNFVTTIVMDHPPLSKLDTRVNTMGPGLVDELGKVQDLLYDDPETRVIILRGSKHYFSGGGDFGGEISTEPRNIPWSVKKGVVKGQRVFKRFRDIPIPVIAAIEGYAGGGGLEIAMSCDLRYATEDTVLRQIETAVGMIPGWGGTQLMVRHIGVGRTMELMLLGKEFSAQRAYEIGLINGVFSKEDFEKRYKDLGKSVLGSLSIDRKDKKKKTEHFAHMFSLFDAPAMILITIDKKLSLEYAMLDVGIFLQTFCLLAHERGLGTCIMAATVMYPEIAHEIFSIPETKALIMGAAIGWPALNEPVNCFKRERGSA